MSKKFKKILVVLLSALMVLTYMPSMALTAFAAENAGKIQIVSPDEIPAQEWAEGEDIDLSEVEELDTIKANVAADGKTWSYNVVLKRGEDYTVESYTNQKGPSYVVFTGIGDYEGYTFDYDGGEIVTFWVVETPKDTTYSIELDTSLLMYNGIFEDDGTDVLAANRKTAKEKAEKYVEEQLARGEYLIIRNGTKKIRHGISFVATSEAEDAKGKAGEKYLVDVKLGDKVISEEPIEVTIAKRDISTARLNGKAEYDEKKGEDDVYNAEEKKPTFSKITVDGDELVLPADDYEIDGYENNVNASSHSNKPVANITVKEDSENFTGSGAVGFKIAPFDLSTGNTYLLVKPSDMKSHEYDGEEFKPEITVTAYFDNVPGAKVIPAEDYEIVYERESTDAKVYKIGIKEASKNVRGKIDPSKPGSTRSAKAYEITPADLSDAASTFKYVQKKDVPAGTEFDAFTGTDDDETYVTDYFDVTVNGLKITAKNAKTISFHPESVKDAKTNYSYNSVTGKVEADDEPKVKCTILLDGANNFQNTGKIEYETVVKPFAELYTVSEGVYPSVYDGTAKKPFERELLNGEGKVPAPSAKFADLTADDFEILGFEHNINRGTAIANIQGKGNYLGQKSQIAFTIDPITLAADGTTGPTAQDTEDWPSTGNPTGADQSETRHQNVISTRWYVVDVTGIKDGTYCKDSVIDGATVKLVKVTTTQKQKQTRTSYYRYQNPQGWRWNVGSWENEGAPVEEQEAITLAATDYILTAREFTTTGTQGKLTKVKVTLTDDGNYARDPMYWDNIDVSAANINANKVNLEDAVVTGSIPATMTGVYWTEDNIKKHITVTTKDGFVVPADAYKLSRYPEANPGVGKTVSFRVERVGADEQVIGQQDASVKVEPVDISEEGIVEYFEAAVPTQPEGETWIYNGDEHKAEVASVKILEGLTPLEYPYQATLNHYAVDPETGEYIVDPETEEKVTKDYDLTFTDNVDAGTATVTFTGKGNFTGTATTTFEIAKASFADLAPVMTLTGVENVEYQEGPVEDLSSKLTLEVKDSKTQKYVFKDTDYTVALIKNRYNVDVDEYVMYKVVATEGSNNYVADSFARLFAYPVVEKQLNKNNTDITLEQTAFTLDEVREKEIVVPDPTTEDPTHTKTITVDYVNAKPTVKVGDVELVEDRDYYTYVEGFEEKVYGEEGYVDPKLVFTFKGNYAGIVKLPISIVADGIDFENLRLLPRSKSGLVFSGTRKKIKVDYIGKDDDNAPRDGWYEVVYKDAEGEESTKAPYKVGTYTAELRTKIATTEVEVGQVIDTYTFTITQKQLSKSEFKDIAAALVLGDVQYKADHTEAPAIGFAVAVTVDGVVTAVDDEEFEVLTYDKEWDGDPKSLGNATVALKADSNFKYAESEVELTFKWAKGELSGDPMDYFEIPDQEYTGEELEPTTILTKEGWDLDPSWVTVKHYEDNVEIAEKTAKAYVEVVIPADAKYVYHNGSTEEMISGKPTNKFTGYITFNIKDHEITPEEARKDAEDAEHAAALVRQDENMPDSQKAKVAAAADALAAVLENPLATPEEIEAAVDAVNEAVAEAYAFKDACEEALATELVAGLMILTGDYTDATVTALDAAAQALEAVIADPSSTSDDVYDATAFLAAIIEKAELKSLTTVSLADTTVTYNGKAPEMPTPTILG
ncbi:MAG: hypothetical protein IJH41_05150, partial [Eubacterium sp.]|nr:hypothetical protein [Eubacterium sp.]